MQVLPELVNNILGNLVIPDTELELVQIIESIAINDINKAIEGKVINTNWYKGLGKNKRISKNIV